MFQAILIFISFVLIASGFWISATFAKPSFEQSLYHLQFGLTGIIDTDMGLIKDCFFLCIILPLCLTIICYYAAKIIKPIKFISLNSKKTIYILCLAALIIFVCKIGLPNHIKKTVLRGGGDYFSDHYINPNDV